MKSSSSAKRSTTIAIFSTQENDALRTRTEELVVHVLVSRQLSELRDERDELKGLLGKLENSI